MSIGGSAVIIVNQTSKEIVSMTREAEKICSAFSSYNIPSHILNGSSSSLRIGHSPIPETHLAFLFERESASITRVTIECDPPMDEVMRQIECAKYVMNTIHQGVGLMLVECDTDIRIVYASNRFRSLLNLSEDFTEIVSCAVPEDRENLERFLADMAVKESGELEFRLNNDSTEMRRMTRSAAIQYSERKRYVSLMVETVEDEIPCPVVGPSLTLNSFLGCVFDARFYVDKDFRIVSDDASMPRLRLMLLQDASDRQISLQGKLVESFIPIDSDRVRFREEIARKITSKSPQIPEDITSLKCESIKTKFLFADNVLTKVKLFVTSTFVDNVDPFNEESLKAHMPQGNDFAWILVKNAAAQNPSKYMVGLRVLGKSDRTIPETGYTPVTEESGASTEQSTFETSQRLKSPPSTLEQVPEHSESELSSESFMAVTGAPKTVSRHQTSIQSLERCLSRDIMVSLSRLEKAHRPHKVEWLIPSYEVADFEVLQDELVRSLRSDLQYHFMTSVQRRDFQRICELLNSTIFGCLNPLKQGLAISDNSDLVLSAFRFLVGTASTVRELALLVDSVGRLAQFLGQSAGDVAKQAGILGLLSGAIRNFKYVNSTAHLNALREAFTEALKLREAESFLRSQRLPTLYFICILWACLMHLLDRKGESIPVLENLSEDMINYCKRHPQSSLVGKLQAICWHNLAVSAMENNDLVTAFNWIYKLQTLSGERMAPFPEPCKKLIEWAKNTQAMVQRGEISISSTKGG
jgi:hypothetical protein